MMSNKSLAFVFIFVGLVIFLSFYFGPGPTLDPEQKDLRELQSLTKQLNHATQELEILQLKLERQIQMNIALGKKSEQKRNEILKKNGTK